MTKAPIGGYVDPNFPNPNTDGDAPIIIYGYTPSFALGVLGCVLFFISTILHILQLVRYRTWWFTPIAVGTTMEIVGYVCRCLSSKISPYRVVFFVVQYFFIVVAPVMYSAAIYTILSILIKRLAGRRFSPLPPKLILWIFITCDVVATGVQVAGAALIGVAESNRKDPTTANNILLAGLAFQVFAFFLFIVLLGIFLLRARRYIGTGGSHARSTGTTFDKAEEDRLAGTSSAAARPVKWSFIFALVLATVMVYLRTCFRLAETAEGLYGRLSTHEVFFGCLEFAPIVIAVYTFNLFHPGRCIPVRLV